MNLSGGAATVRARVSQSSTALANFEQELSGRLFSFLRLDAGVRLLRFLALRNVLPFAVQTVKLIVCRTEVRMRFNDLIEFLDRGVLVPFLCEKLGEFIVGTGILGAESHGFLQQAFYLFIIR